MSHLLLQAASSEGGGLETVALNRANDHYFGTYAVALTLCCGRRPGGSSNM